MVQILYGLKYLRPFLSLKLGFSSMQLFFRCKKLVSLLQYNQSLIDRKDLQRSVEMFPLQMHLWMHLEWKCTWNRSRLNEFLLICKSLFCLTNIPAKRTDPHFDLHTILELNGDYFIIIWEFQSMEICPRHFWSTRKKLKTHNLKASQYFALLFKPSGREQKPFLVTKWPLKKFSWPFYT